LKPQPCTLTEVWQEWFGLGDFDDGLGGVVGQNTRFGNKWRREAKFLDASQFSQTQRIIVVISTQAHERSVQPEEIVAEWESMFEAANKSLGNLVRALQQLNYIPKRKSRGRHNKKDQ
jgi:Transcriptional activator of glycolytic enzymes